MFGRKPLTGGEGIGRCLSDASIVGVRRGYDHGSRCFVRAFRRVNRDGDEVAQVLNERCSSCAAYAVTSLIAVEAVSNQAD